MTDVKYFHLGQFFKKRALLATFFGVGLVALTEFVLPWLGHLRIDTFWQWITPATIIFTISIILVFSALAKNVVASTLLGVAAVLSFYSPYSTVDVGFFAVVIIYLIIAFFAGFFATVEMTGRTALLVIGIIVGLQGLIGAGTSMFISLTGEFNAFHQNSVNIAYGDIMGRFPVYDTIVAIFSLIYMIVFIILSRKSITTTHSSQKNELIGQILIFLSIAGGFIFILVSPSVLFDQNTAVSIFGLTNTQFLNSLFAKTIGGTLGTYTAYTLLNVLYLLPIVSFVIGIGLAFIIYQRANGTTGKLRLNFEGPFVVLNLAPFLVICAYSYIFQNVIGDVTHFFLDTPTWFTFFTEYTNLILINLLIAYIVFKIISFIRGLAQRKEKT
ncbi:MAG: hypothetical protein KAS63_08845 [Candidatus Heimdallarchaeota archaeon]|nr:hypothetical protein [Candidatus Heimdallarchaeota archaeon]MCK4955455.1 hypothetical protein [Candidatus Heimdallarchaeota archaeon]